MTTTEQSSKLSGTVDSILFKNEQNGYVVLTLDTGGDPITVVGELGDIEEGEALDVTGEYTNHIKFGTQFKAVYCERRMPSTVTAILKYLASGAIKGIGPKMAEAIVNKFGTETFDILEKDSQRLLEIKGITPKKLESISMEFQRIFGIRTLMITLQKYGIAPRIAVSAWRKWGQFAIDVINENPYALCAHDIELPFEKAEYVAQQMKISSADVNRLRAGISHVLIRNTYNGHTCLPKDKLLQLSCRLLDVESDRLEAIINDEIEENNLASYTKKNREFIYLYDYYIAESYIAGRLSVLCDFMKQGEQDYTALIELEEQCQGISYGELQKKAISLALQKGFMILTGGPGTGKTTTLEAMISLYEQQGMVVKITAPTGRAAKRISDLTGYEAKTIHRMLEVGFDNNGNMKFLHDEENPLECDVLIVDEMSMVDALLFEALLRALKLSCRLIMVGDSDQLPSVGAGNVLKDMIDCDRLSVVRLKEVFRQAQLSCIVTNAHRIVRGEMPELSRKDNDFFFFSRPDTAECLETVIDLCTVRLPKAYDYSPLDDIQVLSPTRIGSLGVAELNKALQERINPHDNGKSEIKSMQYVFRDGDKVMQTRNNYNLTWSKDGSSGAGVFNGDIGIIQKVRRADNLMIIDFDGRITEYGFDQLDQLELAYAVTVHKSQGSEFNAVVIPLLGGFDKLYYRNLLYTAVTRARKLLIIVGTVDNVKRMVENDRRVRRYTCLKEMLQAEINGSIDDSEESTDTYEIIG